MKVVQLKEAKASIERRKYKDQVLASYDNLSRATYRERRTVKADVERKAREAL